MEQNPRRKVWKSKILGRVVDRIKQKKGSGAQTGGIGAQVEAAQASMGSASVSRDGEPTASATAPDEGPRPTTPSSREVEAVSPSSAQEPVPPIIVVPSHELPTVPATHVRFQLMTDSPSDGPEKGKGGEIEPSDEPAVPPTISLRRVWLKFGMDTARDIAVLLKQTIDLELPLDKNLRCESGFGMRFYEKTPCLLLSGTRNEKYQRTLSPAQKEHFPGATALFMQAHEKDEQGVVRRISFTPEYAKGPTDVLRTSPSASISKVTEAFPEAGFPHGTSAKSLSGAAVEPTTLNPILSDAKSSELDLGSEPGRVAGGETLESTKEPAGSDLLEARRIKQEIVDISGDSKSLEIWVTSALHWFKKRTLDLPEDGFRRYYETTADSIIKSWGKTVNVISDLSTRDEQDNFTMYPILIGGKQRWRQKLGGGGVGVAKRRENAFQTYLNEQAEKSYTAPYQKEKIPRLNPENLEPVAPEDEAFPQPQAVGRYSATDKNENIPTLNPENLRAVEGAFPRRASGHSMNVVVEGSTKGRDSSNDTAILMQSTSTQYNAERNKGTNRSSQSR